MGVLGLQLLNHELLVAQLLLTDVTIVLNERNLQLVYLLLLMLDYYFLFLVQFEVLRCLDFEFLGADELKMLEFNLALLRLEFCNHLLNDLFVGALFNHNGIDFCSVANLEVVHHFLQVLLANSN